MKTGKILLKSIFTWFIAMTKEKRKFHVVLCSSDSFMHNWLSNFIGNNRFCAYVIGHLSYDEAKEFWKAEVISTGDFLARMC